jgi:hypothetical protein
MTKGLRIGLRNRQMVALRLCVIAALVSCAVGSFDAEFGDPSISDSTLKAGDIFVPSASFPAGWRVSAWGVNALWRLPRAVFRGLLTAVRDILFPVRPQVEEMREDEDTGEFALREFARVELLKFANKCGVQRAYESNPSAVRYAFAGAFGFALMAVFFSLQMFAGWCARRFTAAIMRWLGEDGPNVREASESVPAVRSDSNAQGLRQRLKASK